MYPMTEVTQTIRLLKQVFLLGCLRGLPQGINESHEQGAQLNVVHRNALGGLLKWGFHGSYLTGLFVTGKVSRVTIMIISSLYKAACTCVDDMKQQRLALTEKELASALSMSVSFLRKDRITRRIIPFYRIGDSIRYDVDRVKAALLKLEEGGSVRLVKYDLSSVVSG